MERWFIVLAKNMGKIEWKQQKSSDLSPSKLQTGAVKGHVYNFSGATDCVPSEMHCEAWRRHLTWLSGRLQRASEEEEEADADGGTVK